MSVVRTVGRIAVNWGKAEGFAGLALVKIYSLPPEAASDLIHIIDLRKKFDLLDKLFKAGKILADLAPVMTEMRWINNRLRTGRNHIAHGVWAVNNETGVSALLSLTKETYTTEKDMTVLLDQSRFTLRVMNHLAAWVEQQTLREGLPERPPLLPWQE